MDIFKLDSYMASSDLYFFILRLPVISQLWITTSLTNILKVILHQSSMNYEELQESRMQVFITQDILAIFDLKLFAHCLQCSPIP